MALDSLATAVSVPTTTYVPAYAPLAPRPFVDALTPESTHRIDSAPLPLLGAADTTVAVSPLAHGLTTPGSITATRPTPRRLPASDDWRGAFDAERAVLTLSRLAAASHPELIERAVTSYARFLEQHGDEVRNPYYYVVDYGLSNLTPRGYLFDMQSLTVVDGPFMVAHGSRSLAAADGVPRSFGNADESKKTSLGFFTTGALYAFRGHSNGVPYDAVGVRLDGRSGRFNDAARARGVVIHGAKYVTPTRAGRSAGCPALELARAERLLPLLANGGAAFLYSPNDPNWLAHDPWAGSEH